MGTKYGSFKENPKSPEYKLRYQRKYNQRNKEKYGPLIKEFKRVWHIQIRTAWLTIIKERGMDKCSLCGYDECFASIDFHHIEKAEKETQISTLTRTVITPKRLAELDKCIAICANCHRKLHYLENHASGRE